MPRRLWSDRLPPEENITKRRKPRSTKDGGAYRAPVTSTRRRDFTNLTILKQESSKFDCVVALPSYQNVTYGPLTSPSRSSEEERLNELVAFAHQMKGPKGSRNMLGSQRHGMRISLKRLDAIVVEDNFSDLSLSLYDEFDSFTSADVSDNKCCKRQVLKLCEKKKTLSFTKMRNMNACKKMISEDETGMECYLCQWNDKSTVIRIIPIEGKTEISEITQQKFTDMLPVTLRYRLFSQIPISRVPTFTYLLSCWSVYGEYPDELLKVRKEYQSDKGVQLHKSNAPRENQMYIIHELVYGGCKMNDYKFTSAAESLSAFLQVAYALASAEITFEFELRSVHWSSIHIKPTKLDAITYKINSKKYDIITMGIQALISDFSVSRMKYKNICLYVNLDEKGKWPLELDSDQLQMFQKMQLHTKASRDHEIGLLISHTTSTDATEILPLQNYTI